MSEPSRHAGVRPLVEVEGLTRRYRRHADGRRGQVEALAGVDLLIGEGASLALVGQSGSGKSTLARCLALLDEPTGGRIRFEGVDLASLRGRARRAHHERVQLVFQDAAGTLSPRLSASEIVAEPLLILGRGDGRQRRARARELMDLVSLPAALAERRPHELSGGQRQRLALARALAVGPRLLVLDEAFAGLDSCVQAQVASVLRGLRAGGGLGLLTITHDLGFAAAFADEVAVLYQGRVVERAPARGILRHPRHEHTRALVAAVPVLPSAGAGA